MPAIYKSTRRKNWTSFCTNFFVLCVFSNTCSVLQAQENSASLEEIIVTAKKRSQNLREVDISMSVVSAATVEALQLRSLPEAAALIENVSLFEDFPGAGIPTWVIRGVGLQDFNSNNTPTAGVYLDNSYQVATVMGGTSLFDIDQLEILKGPQGGLYGRNTSGGAVVLNTRRAALDTFEGEINAGLGSWTRRSLDGAVNIPVNQTTALRLSGNIENSDEGWQKNIYTGQSHGALDRWDIRNWLLFQPSDDFAVHWKIQTGRDDSEIALGRSVGMYDPVNYRPVGRKVKLCDAVLSGRRDDATCISMGEVSRRIAGSTISEQISDQARDGSEVFSGLLNRQQNEYVSSMLELQWRLNDMELMSITSYDKFDYGVDLDLDGSRGEYGHRLSTSDIEVFNQEFRVSSARGEKLQWLAGVVWSDETFIERRDFNGRDHRVIRLGQAELGYDQLTDSAAVFGDMEYEISDEWRINANLRYTWEEKELEHANFYIPPMDYYYLENGSSTYKLENPYSGSVALNWLPSETTFAYMKLSNGFKSGGFYGGFPFEPSDMDPYAEETVRAFEVGVKQSWPEMNLDANAAVFYYELEDVQGLIGFPNPVTGTTIDRLTNQGNARHKGAEFQMDYRPLDSVRFELGLAWLDAQFLESGKTTENIDKNLVAIQGRRPYAPSLSGNLLMEYSQGIYADGFMTLTMAYNYRSEFTGNTTSLSDSAINSLPGYGVMDASAMFEENGKPWKINVWVKNLLDRTYRTRVKSDGLDSYVDFFGEPRSLGVALSYGF